MIKTAVEHLSGIGFNGDTHVHHFINYLFRIDEDQKWTNALTDMNIVCIYDDDGKHSLNIFESNEKRIELSGVVHQTFKNSSFKELACDILYFEGYEQGAFVEDLDSLYELALAHINSSRKSKRNVVYVLHLDQEQSPKHIHSMYIGNCDLW